MSVSVDPGGMRRRRSSAGSVEISDDEGRGFVGEEEEGEETTHRPFPKLASATTSPLVPKWTTAHGYGPDSARDARTADDARDVKAASVPKGWEEG